MFNNLNRLYKNNISTSKVDRSYLKKYASKFTSLNEKDLTSGVLGKIRQFLGTLTQNLNQSLKWQTHMHAEHMSRGSLSGNREDFAMGKTLEVLNEMSSPPEKLIKALKYATNIASKTPLISSNTIKNDLKKLAIGESLAIPSSCERHTMILYITRQEKGKFKVVQHNQGLGINTFHYSKVDAKGKKLFQTAIEIVDVPEENLCGANALFINRVIGSPLLGTVDNLYMNLLPLLGGKLQEPSNDPRLWSHGQIGNSCSAGASLSLIRSQLDRDAYKKFRDIGRTEMLLKSYKQIKQGWGNNGTQIAVTLEVVKKLEHSLKKENIDLPAEIQEMKKQLTNINKKIGTDVRPDSLGVIDNINSALITLEKGHFDDDSLNAARPFIEKALTASQSPATAEELEMLLKITNQLQEYCKDRPLTVNQIYVMTILSSALLEKVLQSKDVMGFDNKKGKVSWDFSADMHHRYNGLSLGSQFQNPSYDIFLLPYQKIHISDKISIPDKLKELKEKF